MHIRPAVTQSLRTVVSRNCAVQASLDFVALLLQPAADHDGCLELRPGAPTAKAVAVTEGRLAIAVELVRPGIELSLSELPIQLT